MLIPSGFDWGSPFTMSSSRHKYFQSWLKNACLPITCGKSQSPCFYRLQSLLPWYLQSFKAQMPTNTAKLKLLINSDQYIMRAKGFLSLAVAKIFQSRSSATVVAHTSCQKILRVPMTVRPPGAGCAPVNHAPVTRESVTRLSPVFAILFLFLKCDCTLPFWFKEFIRILQFGYDVVYFS